MNLFATNKCLVTTTPFLIPSKPESSVPIDELGNKHQLGVSGNFIWQMNMIQKEVGFYRFYFFNKDISKTCLNKKNWRKINNNISDWTECLSSVSPSVASSVFLLLVSLLLIIWRFDCLILSLVFWWIVETVEDVHVKVDEDQLFHYWILNWSFLSYIHRHQTILCSCSWSGSVLHDLLLLGSSLRLQFKISMYFLGLFTNFLRKEWSKDHNYTSDHECDHRTSE